MLMRTLGVQAEFNFTNIELSGAPDSTQIHYGKGFKDFLRMANIIITTTNYPPMHLCVIAKQSEAPVVPPLTSYQPLTYGS